MCVSLSLHGEGRPRSGRRPEASAHLTKNSPPVWRFASATLPMKGRDRYKVTLRETSSLARRSQARYKGLCPHAPDGRTGGGDQMSERSVGRSTDRFEKKREAILD